MKFVSLFSGIGGIDLGLERAGMECVGQVEYDPWCNQILEKHWPDTPRWQDIHDLDPEELPDHDLIAGGFPCQPVSFAGKRLAQDDPRWLWPEFYRIVRMVRPRFVLVENVPGLASAGMGDVLGDLAALGYDTEWDRIPACYVGAPHSRPRVFIVTHPSSQFGNGVAHHIFRGPRPVPEPRDGDPKTPGRWSNRPIREPGILPVADGVPRRVDRLRGLGNAVVPQVAELVGRMILDANTHR